MNIEAHPNFTEQINTTLKEYEQDSYRRRVEQARRVGESLDNIRGIDVRYTQRTKNNTPQEQIPQKVSDESEEAVLTAEAIDKPINFIEKREQEINNYELGYGLFHDYILDKVLVDTSNVMTENEKPNDLSDAIQTEISFQATQADNHENLSPEEIIEGAKNRYNEGEQVDLEAVVATELARLVLAGSGREPIGGGALPAAPLPRPWWARMGNVLNRGLIASRNIAARLRIGGVLRFVGTRARLFSRAIMTRRAMVVAGIGVAGFGALMLGGVALEKMTGQRAPWMAENPLSKGPEIAGPVRPGTQGRQAILPNLETYGVETAVFPTEDWHFTDPKVGGAAIFENVGGVIREIKAEKDLLPNISSKDGMIKSIIFEQLNRSYRGVSPQDPTRDYEAAYNGFWSPSNRDYLRNLGILESYRSGFDSLNRIDPLNPDILSHFTQPGCVHTPSGPRPENCSLRQYRIIKDVQRFIDDVSRNSINAPAISNVTST